MGNTASSLSNGQNDLVFDTYTNSGTSFKVALWGAMRKTKASANTNANAEADDETGKGKGCVEAGIADVWANMFVDSEDVFVPVHVGRP